MNPFDLSFTGTGALVLFLAKATVLLIAALVATALLRRSTAGARHLVWLAALVGVLALPLLSRISSLKLGVLPSAFGGPVALVVTPPAALELPTLAPPALAPPVSNPARERERSAKMIAPVIASRAVSGGVSGGVSDGVFSVFPALAESGYTILSVIAIAWTFVALALVAWLVAGAFYVRRIVDAARELTSPDWTTPLCEVADRLDLDVPPRIVLSERIEMAFACRALAPTIVLPASAEEWTDDRRRAVLFHELAHIKRHDLVGHTLGRLACALYWFHPLVWTAAKRLRAESERACDDLVLSCGARPSEYAQHLLDMVTNVRDLGAPVMALPMARKKEFEGRMLAILDPAIRRASPGRLQAAAVITTLGMLSLTVAAVSPASATPTPTPSAALQTSEMAVEQSAPPEVPRSSPPPSAARTAPPVPFEAPAPTPQPSPPPGVNVDVHSTPNGISVSVGGLKTVRDAVINSVGSALSSLGLNTMRALQATDTGRIALMIKVLGTDSDASVRRTAAWALHDVESPNVRSALVSALHSDADEHVRETAAWALGDQGNGAAGSALSDALVHDKSAHVRTTAAWALGEIADKTHVPVLESAMVDADEHVRENAIWALGQLELRTAPKLLANALTDQAKSVRVVTAWALGEIEDKSTAPAILVAYKTETDPQVRSAELRALAVMGQASAEVVEEALKSSDPEVRRRAVALLAGSSSVEPWPWPRPQPRPSP